MLDDDTRPAKRARLSEANTDPFDTGFSSPGQETYASWQPRPASPASSFGSVDSGLSHPPRANTGAKKVVGASFSQLSDQTYAGGLFDAPQYFAHPLHSYASYAKLTETVQHWKTLLLPAAQDWGAHEKTLDELRGQFACARVQFRREEAARIWNKLVHATLNWYEYARDFVQLQQRLEFLDRFLKTERDVRFPTFSFPCPWKDRPGCSHPIAAYSQEEHL